MGVYVRVGVGAETYAIPVTHVVEVGNLGQVTPVPGVRPEMLGVTNVRGQVLPVADLAAFLRVPRPGSPRCLAVVEEGGHKLGLATDSVTDVTDMADPDNPAGSDLLTGATLADGALVGVIDVPRLFAVIEGPAR